MTSPTHPRVLIVDLNNFARYPTIAVGYLTAILRNAGMHVEVFSPLASGVRGVVREPRARPWGLIEQRVRYWSSVSRNTLIRTARARLAALAAPDLSRHADDVLRRFAARAENVRPDVVLVSAYLMYEPLCRRIGRICCERGMPMLVGGPYFAQPEVLAEWTDIEGLTALVGGEVEPHLPALVESAATGTGDLPRVQGVWVPDPKSDGPLRLRGQPAPPLRDLDVVPFPDYSDFPWDRYPNRIVPLITGRGCGWGACAFCSDVTSTAGRTFRSRSADNVLEELRHQSRRHDARLFVFTDLKLNSSPPVWEALLSRFQQAVPGGEWIGLVHVGAQQPNGLSAAELRAARSAGMVRLSTGLESGSQRVLDAMAKGTHLSDTSRFLKDARGAGISVRATMIVGYPGEAPEDVSATARFLEAHADCLERVVVNRFQLMTGTRIHRTLEKRPEAVPSVTQVVPRHRLAQLDHAYEPVHDRRYRRAVAEILCAAHRINRKPLNPAARQFEGVM